MTQEEQQNRFAAEANKVIDRFISEYDLSIASAIGVLEGIKLELFMEQLLPNTDEKD